MQGPPLPSQTGVAEEYETSDEDDEDYEMQSAEDEDDDEDEDDGDSNQAVQLGLLFWDSCTESILINYFSPVITQDISMYLGFLHQ